MKNSIYLSKKAKPFRYFAVLLLLPLVTATAFANNGNGNDKDKNKLKVTVLQNHEQGDCLYSGDVILDVRYKFHRTDQGELQVAQSTDGQSFTTVQNHQLDGRRGNIIVEVDAGDCSKDLRLSLHEL